MVSAAFDLLPRLQPIQNLTCTKSCQSSDGKLSSQDIGPCYNAMENTVAPVSSYDNTMCLAYMNYMQCAFCSPAQARFYVNGRVDICEDFCLQTYRFCKNMGVAVPDDRKNDKDLVMNVSFQFAADREARFVSYTRPKTIRELFPDTSRYTQDGHIKMCERQGFTVQLATGNAPYQPPYPGTSTCFRPSCDGFQCVEMPNHGSRTGLW